MWYQISLVLSAEIALFLPIQKYFGRNITVLVEKGLFLPIVGFLKWSVLTFGV